MATRTKKSTDINPADAKETTASSQPQSAAPKQNGAQNDKQSQLATILVGLLIIASGLLIYNYFQKSSTPETTNQSEQQNEENQQANNNQETENESESEAENKEGEYTVMPGDSLWSIAENVYGNGFEWTKIRDANNLDTNAYGQPTVEIGQVINVPGSAAVAQQPSESESGTGSTSGESDVAGVDEVRETPSTAIETYTVQSGDTLWSIAESEYGDGHKWVLIMNDPHNNIGQMPDGRPLVHAGNELYIPQAP